MGWLDWARWMVVNGNFYKLLSLIVTLMLGVIMVMQQNNYTRLEERIMAVQESISTMAKSQAILRSDITSRHEKLADKHDDLAKRAADMNTEVRGSIEQIRAQMNMVLYRVLDQGKNVEITP